MSITLQVCICPHCSKPLEKQVDLSKAGHGKAASVGVRQCEKCQGEFVVYARAEYTVSTKRVIDGSVE